MSEERAAIQDLSNEGLSKTQSAKHVKRSRKAERNVLNGLTLLETRSRIGRPRKISATTSRAIVRKASDGFRSVREHRYMVNMHVFVRRAQQLLEKAHHLEYPKIETSPHIDFIPQEIASQMARTHLHPSRSI